jgi:uncharacterized protein YndB with AHSA1/START domain
MPVVEHAVDVAAPPEECYRVFSDLEAWPRWFPYLARAAGELRVGGTLHLTFAAGDRPIPVTVAVEEVAGTPEPMPEPIIVRWTGSGFGLRGRHTHSFADNAAGGTRVSWREEISGIAARLLTSNVLARIEDEVRAAMHKLKALVEARAT